MTRMRMPAIRATTGWSERDTSIESSCRGGSATGPAGDDRPATLVDGHEDAVTERAVHRLREVPLARRVLDQDHLAGADDAALPVAGRDPDPGVEVDYVLTARRRVPVEVVGGRHLTEDEPHGREAPGELAAARLLDPLDLDVPEVGLAAGV